MTASIPYFLLILLVFLADRLSKLWAFAYLSAHGPTQVNGLLSIQETYNRGIAFGMLQGIGPLVGWLTIAIVAGMFIYLLRLPKGETMIKVGLALVIGGAMGNLIDRVIVGQVLDFIETPLRSGIFNVADVAINLGMILVLLATVLSLLRSRSQSVTEAPPSI